MLTAREVAELVGGELRGDGEATISRVAPIDRATTGSLTFLGVAKYAPMLAASEASVALVSPELADTPGGVSARVVVAKPYEAMLRLLPLLFAAPARAAGVDPTVRIGRGATLGDDVSIGPYVVIGDGARIGDRVRLDAHVVVGDGVDIGADSHLFPHVTTYAGTTIGERVVAHAGVRLGGDGFGFVFAQGAHQKIPHVGRCVIEHDVEIGANTTIDRGSIDDTVIGAGTKIDNLVMIAHNVRVGRLCLIVAQAGIAGSTRIGRWLHGRRDRLACRGTSTIGDRGPARRAGGRARRRAGGRDLVRLSRPPASRGAAGAGGAVQALGVHSPTRAAARQGGVVSSVGVLGRQTILGEASLAGIGLHLGLPCTLTFRPAPSGSGIRFARVDLAGTPTIRADVSVAVETERRTQLGEGPEALHTVEHVLAAVAALQIDDILIEMDGPEPPILDGSAGPFFRALEAAGIAPQGGRVEVLSLSAPIRVEHGESWYEAYPADALSLEVAIDFPHPLIGQQRGRYAITPAAFATELADARTFGFAHEVAYLRERGLIKGGTTENALVLGPDGVMANALRWTDEFVRHKAMDCVGDLALAGKRVCARVVAHRPSHAGTVRLVREMTRACVARNEKAR